MSCIFKIVCNKITVYIIFLLHCKSSRSEFFCDNKKHLDRLFRFKLNIIFLKTYFPNLSSINYVTYQLIFHMFSRFRNSKQLFKRVVLFSNLEYKQNQMDNQHQFENQAIFKNVKFIPNDFCLPIKLNKVIPTIHSKFK